MTFWTQTVSDVVDAMRSDADHFQPKYKAIEANIRAKRNRAKQLGSLVSYVRRGSQPEYVPDGDVLVINSQHVSEHLINIDGAARTTMDFWERKPGSRTRKFDILLNSTGVGTIGRANCVLHDEKSVVDNHVTVLRVNDPDEMNPLFLAVFLNSAIGRQQTYKWQSGSSGQLEIYPNEIKQFWVPIPAPAVQTDIASQLQSAHDNARRASAAASAAEAAVVAIVAPTT
ncbi:restriction endonuclease subunit S [uncultured Jatrophihabitans sp.]|uniref:restriction endonuclease subunit S n=1 Tax=uncultured Jatrophihabitans sp. TaxID=1610747 RepID=UPI0035C9C113